MISLSKLLRLFLSSYLVLLQVSVTVAQNDGRIVGGYSTTINQAPYLVQIKNEGKLLCGGTLVSRRYVVTAAHCFIYNPKDLLVVAGATKLTDVGTARSTVTGWIKHTAYTKEGYDMDIAVMKLSTPLKGKFVKPISFNCSQDWTVGQTVKLFGWGQLDEKSISIPIDLQTVEVKVYDKKKCARNYRFKRKLTDSMVCAAAPNKDTCSGDSGGPAIINNEFCGVVSWAIGCAQEDAPGVYTSVKVVEKFIRSAIKQLSKKK